VQKYTGDIKQHLNTGLLGKIIPSIKDQYGDDTQLDVMFTNNHEVFVDGVPDAEPMGIYFEKNDRVRLVLNLHIDLRLDHSGESIRHIYLTLNVKGKAAVWPIRTSEGKVDHRLEFTSAEISKMVVYSMNPLKEEPNEAALFHGAGGLQLQSLSKKYSGMFWQPTFGDLIDKYAQVTGPVLE